MARTVHFTVGVPLTVVITGKEISFEVDLSEVEIIEDDEAAERYTAAECRAADEIVSAATAKIHHSVTHIIHRSAL
jgi:hypothetical protein